MMNRRRTTTTTGDDGDTLRRGMYPVVPAASQSTWGCRRQWKTSLCLWPLIRQSPWEEESAWRSCCAFSFPKLFHLELRERLVWMRVFIHDWWIRILLFDSVDSHRWIWWQLIWGNQLFSQTRMYLMLHAFGKLAIKECAGKAMYALHWQPYQD